MKKDRNAYFTVEAALVLPVVIAVLLFVIYMMLFQYDRCLLEQDLGGIALWGALVDASDAEELTQKTQKRLGEMYRDKYIAWKITGLNAGLDENKFHVNGAGQLTFPVPNWNIWSSGNVWGTDADYSYSRMSPVSFIRLCHKFQEYAGR